MTKVTTKEVLLQLQDYVKRSKEVVNALHYDPDQFETAIDDAIKAVTARDNLIQDPNVQFYWRIRLKDGTYSVGGQCPHSSKKGKDWKNVGHLHNHLAQLDRNGRRYYKDNDAVIQKFAVNLGQQTVEERSVVQYLQDRDQRIANDQRIEQERRNAQIRELEVRQLQELQRKYPFGK